MSLISMFTKSDVYSAGMPNDRETVRFLPNEPLRDSLRQATSMSLPLPVHQRLTLLAELAADVAPSRAEIISMLIADASLDADQLEHLILRYRKKTIGDVLPQSSGGSRGGDGEVIQIMTPRRGRPPKR